MKAAARVGCALLLSAALAGTWTADPRAIVLSLTRVDMERAAALARWPHSDADRTQFHKRYIFAVNEPPTGPWAVDTVEIITEFRRIELMAEDHVRLADSWGRGGVRDIEEAIRPWRGRVSVVAHLALRAKTPYVGPVPPVTIALGGPGAVDPIDIRRTNLYASCGDQYGGCALIGGLVEAVLDAPGVGQATRLVTVGWTGQEPVHVTIDFAALD